MDISCGAKPLIGSPLKKMLPLVDGTYPEVSKPSPNVSSSRIRPEGVVLHHSSGSYAGSVSWICQSKSQVSYHCIIDTNGERTIFADDDRRCRIVWEAPLSDIVDAIQEYSDRFVPGYCPWPGTGYAADEFEGLYKHTP